jgi:hypothetical protein
MPSTLRFHRRAKGKFVGTIRPVPERIKGMCLDIEEDH